MVKFLFAFLLLALRASAATQIWYVSQTGAGSQNGTSADDAWSVADFNAAASWSGAGGSAEKISPGATVNVLGTISTPMHCAGDGLPEQVITIAFDPASTAVSGFTFTFSGRDYIRLTGLRLADNFNTGPRTPVVTFAAGSANTADHCQVDHMYSSRKIGSGFIQVGYCNYATVSDCTFLDFFGMGMTMSNAPVDHLTIQNNVFETVNTFADPAQPVYLNGTGQNDILHLAWATNVSIKGNRMILRGSVAPGTDLHHIPHNDIIQCYRNPSNFSQKPANWTVANNWMEIDGAINGSGYNNFGMLQWVLGTWAFYGNVFYSHDLSSGISNGIDLEPRAAAAGVTAKFYNNTFVSLRKGLTLCISNRTGYAGANNDRLEVVNNIFNSDIVNNTAPIMQGASEEPNGSFLMKNNVIRGWNFAVINVNNVAGRRIHRTQFGAVSRTPTADLDIPANATASQVGLVSTTRGSEDFALTSGSTGRKAGAPVSTGLSMPVSATKASFPHPKLTNAKSTSNIGACQLDSTSR